MEKLIYVWEEIGHGRARDIHMRMKVVHKLTLAEFDAIQNETYKDYRMDWNSPKTT